MFAAPSIRTKTALRQLFGKGNVGIEEILLKRPVLKLVVGASGNVNWDLLADSESKEEAAAVSDSDEEGIVFQLDKIGISNADFIYEDREADILFRLNDINIGVSGEMYGTEAQLLAEGTAAQLFLSYAGVNYITNTSVETRTKLNVDYDIMDIEIQENELLINRLPLEVLGMIQMPDDTM